VDTDTVRRLEEVRARLEESRSSLKTFSQEDIELELQNTVAAIEDDDPELTVTQRRKLESRERALRKEIARRKKAGDWSE